MYIIFKVAQAELRNLFYSPIAWLLTVVFFVVAAIQFVTPIENYSRIQAVLLENMPNWTGFLNGLSWDIFSASYGQIVDKLYLFMPLLTMGIINREVQSGSIKLLYSSPIRTRDIILGKYLALVMFNVVLLVCVAILLTTGAFSIVHPEYKWFLSALLAIFLLANTYAAIGIFISAITSYQIVAGILTFVIFFILFAIQGLWQQFDFVRDLTWFLSISGRTSSMLYGLITTRDLCYFLLIIVMFLAFAMIKLKSTQESRHWRVAFTRYIACFLVVLTLGYLTSRPGYIGYLDVTKRKLNTIHPATRKVLKELDGSPLNVTLYTNLLGKNLPAGLPQNRNAYVWNFWERIIRFYPNINLKYEYYYDFKDGDTSYRAMLRVKSVDEMAEKIAEIMNARLSLFQKPEQIRKKIDLSAEDYNLVMQVEYNGRKGFLRTYPDDRVWPDENHISGTLARICRDSVPNVTFTTGHYERNPYKTGEREFGIHTTEKLSRGSLINKGVDVDTVSLLYQDIPNHTDILVVADPRSALDSIESNKIGSWLDNGGNAIFYAEPGKQQMLRSILQRIGVTPEDGTIVTLNKQEMPHYFGAEVTDTGCYLALEPKLYLFQELGVDKPGVFHTGAVNLGYTTINGFRITPILDAKGVADRWIENGTLVVDSAAPVYAPQEGDIKKDRYITGLKLARQINGKEQRIIITGDADFMSNIRGGGSELNLAAYSWAMYNEYPVYHNLPFPKDIFLTISKQTGLILKPVFIYIIPSIILLTGLILLIRRKRK